MGLRGSGAAQGEVWGGGAAVAQDGLREEAEGVEGGGRRGSLASRLVRLCLLELA